MLAGHASFPSWCASCVQVRGRIESNQAQGRKEHDNGSLVVGLPTVSLRVRNRINEAEVEQLGDSPVLVMHDGVTKSIFAFFGFRERSWFPKP